MVVAGMSLVTVTTDVILIRGIGRMIAAMTAGRDRHMYDGLD